MPVTMVHPWYVRTQLFRFPRRAHLHEPKGLLTVASPPQVTSKNAVKVILLGDSAVGKSKLVERFLMDGYQPQQLSTFALTLFRYNFKHPDGREVAVDFWVSTFAPLRK